MKLKAKKPRELVYIHYFISDLQEGTVYTFFAMDDYSEVLFEYALTPDLSQESCLSVITKLLSDKEFKRFSNHFKLIVSFGEQYIPLMNQLTKPLNGEVLFSNTVAKQKLYPVFKELDKKGG